MASSASLSGTVVVKPRDNAALVQFIAGVSDPSSPLFHQYLRAGAFAGRFGPTAATIAAVRAQLTADGLHVGGVSSDGLLVDFSGTAGQIEHAFQTGVERYRLSTGSVGQTTTSAAAIPSAIPRWRGSSGSTTWPARSQRSFGGRAERTARRSGLP